MSKAECECIGPWMVALSARRALCLAVGGLDEYDQVVLFGDRFLLCQNLVATVIEEICAPDSERCAVGKPEWGWITFEIDGLCSLCACHPGIHHTYYRNETRYADDCTNHERVDL